jgi:flagellar assembly protein FliH
MSTDDRSSGTRGGSRFTAAVFPRIAGRSAELEREAESARVRGYAAGHAEGMRAAAEAAALVQEEIARTRETERIAAERRVAHALVAIEAAAVSLADRERELTATAQGTLERLAIELAEAVVGRELASGEASARAALHRALSRVDPPDVRELRVNPADLDTLRTLGAHPDDIALVPDPALSPGEALAVMSEGSIDARIGAAFDRARAALEAGS